MAGRFDTGDIEDHPFGLFQRAKQRVGKQNRRCQIDGNHIGNNFGIKLFMGFKTSDSRRIDQNFEIFKLYQLFLKNIDHCRIAQITRQMFEQRVMDIASAAAKADDVVAIFQ